MTCPNGFRRKGSTYLDRTVKNGWDVDSWLHCYHLPKEKSIKVIYFY
ncbi:hypothetical protein NC651_012279 [Populus alba x Populus x berolinensis]|nr:hypothetical protein NC651_012279 [Populus alba x Populus x berolinensis]